jgi:DNA-directed RNA polymerase subunit beta
VRSPGVYSAKRIDKSGVPLYDTTVIPNRGAWIEFEQDANDILWVHVDRTRKLTATVLLRALGFGTDEKILALFDNDPMIKATCEKDVAKSEGEGLVELYKRLRPGEVPTEENVKKQLNDLFFDAKRYDLAKVGRYKFNKKLCLATRIKNKISCDDIVVDKAVVVKAGEKIGEQTAFAIQNAGINVVYIASKNARVKVVGNNTVDLKAVLKINPADVGVNDYVNYPELCRIMKEFKGKKEREEEIKKSLDKLYPKHITIDDIIATVSYNLGIRYGVGEIDNIDHLGNRRVRSVGELLQNQFRIGISRLERVIKERMAVQEMEKVTPQSLINIRPVTSAIKEFFGSSQLSQFMDQSNPIAELTHKRKLSALGPGGLNRERATFDVRDVHHSHYGRMCPIETPEGQNIGLISSLSSFARINEYGFIESPYRRVDKASGIVTNEVFYLAADEEDNFYVAQANEPLDKDGHFERERVTCRMKEDIISMPRADIDFMDVSPKQLVSIATSLIPFLENDDTNRALMGSNMQRQAVPLLRTEAPIVGTGMEHKIAYDSGVMVIAEKDGEVISLSADKIVTKDTRGIETEYKLKKFKRSNQGTCINQKPIVPLGANVKTGDVLADGPSTEGGELALGRNMRVAFVSFEGYNYEDAILISEELVRDDTFTSVHIEEHELETRDTKLGQEEITRDIPNVGEDSLKDLDADGIIRIGAEVRPGDILVGKVTPKGETELTPEERLLRAIFSEKARDVRDTSLRVPNGEGGIVVDVKIFTRENKDELSPGVNKLVRVYIAQKRKVSVGDKMAGRHGNKGVISRILPQEDMPFMEDGTPLQIVLNPLGVPSRMNIGQVLEVHLGLVAKMLGWHVATPVFDGANENDIKTLFLDNHIVNPATEKVDGKVTLYDGRTGQPFENRVTVGYMYMLKLVHLVDDKIHARSTGPYSLVTQQPLGGKAQFGGQRFGEMEVWALEAYGASNILQEILTVKSDDVIGRVKTYEAIVKGQNISEQPGVPESFKVLIKELQALSLDVKVLTEDKEEVGIKDIIDEETDVAEIAGAEEGLNDVNLDFEDLKIEGKNVLGEDDFEDDGDMFKAGDLFDEDDEF